MRLDARDIDDLKPLITAVVRATIAEIKADEAKLDDRLGYPEAEAAALYGVPKHVLRDARLDGKIHGRLLGKKIIYSRGELLRFLGDR